MARFKNEARAAGRLMHPHIVAVYEYGEDDNVAFIAMEFVEGAGLREHLNRRDTFDFAQLVRLMRQLLEALEFAHDRGVVHRDIKPSNLIVSEDGKLKVADFGIARVDTTNLTQAGMIIGTPSYMSPEQCRGLDSDTRADLWSAGVVMYELLTGEKPFRGTLETIAYKICHEEPPAPSTLSKLKLPADVDRLVATALAKAPEARSNRPGISQGARRRREAVGGGRRGPRHHGGEHRHADARQAGACVGRRTLRTAEHELARALGRWPRSSCAARPRRRSTARSFARSSRTRISDPESRRRFVTAFNTRAAGRARRAHPAAQRAAARCARRRRERRRAPSPRRWKPRTSSRSRAACDSYRPIAQVLTKKAARESANRAEFVRRCAENLGTQERAAFLREMGYE
jgi:serine/threonine-protein kinase